TGSQQGSVRVWSGSAAPIDYGRHNSAVAAVAVSHDSRRIASASFDNTARLWEVGRPAEPRVLLGHTDAVVSVEFSPDDQQVLTASAAGSVRVWNAPDGTLQWEPQHHGSSVNSAIFDPTGQRIATASEDQTVHVLDPQTRSETSIKLSRPVHGVA